MRLPTTTIFGNTNPKCHDGRAGSNVIGRYLRNSRVNPVLKKRERWREG
jgi:hypothetical protein